MNSGFCAGAVRALVFAAALLLTPIVIASAQELPKYEVTGFRDARFGMGEPEVRAAITKSLGVKATDLTSAANPVEGTTVVTARVASLDPVPGPAQIAFIFGYSSKKLIQVNVIWGDDKPK